MGKMRRLSPRTKKVLWGGISFLLAIASFWAVLKFNGDISLSDLADALHRSSPTWIMAAVLSMLLFIFFEGYSLRIICQSAGHSVSLPQSFLYSAADIYFSAITPSASGGQPASALIMIQSGLPKTLTTAALLLNLTMYTISLTVISTLCLLLNPQLFFRFGVPGRLLIVLGFLVHLLLSVILLLLVRNERLLHTMCSAVVRLLGRLHLIKHPEHTQETLSHVMDDYRRCTDYLKGQKQLLLRTFLVNLLQRLSQISVTMFVFLSSGHSLSAVLSVGAIQSLVLLGSCCVPIPGAMGVSDYLLLDGFGSFLSPPQAAAMELISRSISFYLCAILSGITVLIYTLTRIQRRTTP